MRFLFLVYLCLTFSPGQQTSSTPAAGGAAASNQQKARAVVDQMIAALGGQAYLNLQDAEFEGRSGRFNQGRSEGSTLFHRLWQWPDKDRMELTKQRDVARLALGDNIYEITLRGSRLVDPKKDYDAQVYLERRHHALEIILRQWLNEPGTELFDEGRSIAENHSVERITIINSKNDSVTLSIDADTHLPVKKTFVVRDLKGDRDEITEIYDNWKVIQGVTTPYNTLILRNGELQLQYFLVSVAYNNHPASSLFEPSAPLKRESPPK